MILSYHKITISFNILKQTIVIFNMDIFINHPVTIYKPSLSSSYFKRLLKLVLLSYMLAFMYMKKNATGDFCVLCLIWRVSFIFFVGCNFQVGTKQRKKKETKKTSRSSLLEKGGESLIDLNLVTYFLHECLVDGMSLNEYEIGSRAKKK